MYKKAVILLFETVVKVNHPKYDITMKKIVMINNKLFGW